MSNSEETISFLKKEDVTNEHLQKLLEIFERINSKNIWSKVKSVDDFVVKRFEDGFINDVCACILTEDAKKRLSTSENEPLGVVVKIFQKKHLISDDPVDRALVYSMVSYAGFCPKLIYMDNECSVNEYIFNSRLQEFEDDLDEEFVATIFRKLAHYHYLEVPTKARFQNWGKGLKIFRDTFNGSSDVLNGKIFELLENDPEFSGYKSIIENYKLQNMFDYFPEASHKLNSPLIFSHMDFHRANRLVSIKTLPNGNLKKNIHFIDFDTSRYSYRGFDFGAFFTSYLQEDEVKKVATNFATDEQMLKLIEIYRQECASIKGKSYLLDESNSSQKILQETKFFIIYYYFLFDHFSLSMYCQNPKRDKNRDFFRRVINRNSLVTELKIQYKKHGILPDIGIDI